MQGLVQARPPTVPHRTPPLTAPSPPPSPSPNPSSPPPSAPAAAVSSPADGAMCLPTQAGARPGQVASAAPRLTGVISPWDLIELAHAVRSLASTPPPDTSEQASSVLGHRFSDFDQLTQQTVLFLSGKMLGMKDEMLAPGSRRCGHDGADRQGVVQALREIPFRSHGVCGRPTQARQRPPARSPIHGLRR